MKNKKVLKFPYRAAAVLAIALVLAMTACNNGGGGGGGKVPGENGEGEEEIDLDTPLVNYSVSIPTAGEEAAQFTGVLMDYKWYQDMGYTHVTLPSHSVIDPLKQKVLNGGYLTQEEQTDAYNAFIKDLYNEADYQQSFAKIRTQAVKADKQIDSLRRYETAWGFYIPPRYNVRLTLYGPGGQYNPSTGSIITLVSKSGQLSTPPLDNILHESVHIGIEDRIIQRYGIIHADKERIVDQFVKKQFSSVIPNYRLQSSFANPAIDMWFDGADALDTLPQKIEAALAAMKQEGIAKALSAAASTTQTALEGYWVNTMASKIVYIFKGNAFVEMGDGRPDKYGDIYNYGAFTVSGGTISYTPKSDSWIKTPWTQQFQFSNGELVLQQTPNHSYGNFKNED
jgi:hypothetical protein